jgi:hypothetical protein
MTPVRVQRTSRPNRDQVSLAMKLRDTLVLSEADLVGVANETMSTMSPVVAETFRRRLRASQGFQVAIKRTTIDVGVVLALAKSLASDSEFEDCASLLHDVNLGSHEGMIGTFAEAMVMMDLEHAKRMEAGEIEDDDALLYRLIPLETVVKRLALLARCLHAIKAQLKAESGANEVAA